MSDSLQQPLLTDGVVNNSYGCSPQARESVTPDPAYGTPVDSPYGTPARSVYGSVRSRTAGSYLDSPRIFFMRGISSPHSRKKRAGKFVFAVFNTANAALGTGVLGFPYAFRQAGWLLGLIITLLSAVLLGYALTVILRCAREYDGESYQHLVRMMYGRKAGRALIYILLFFNFMCGTAYLLVIDTQVQYFAHKMGHAHWYMEYPFVMTATSIISIPLAQFRSIDSLGPTSMIGVSAVLFFVFVAIIHGFKEGNIHNTEMIVAEPRALQTIPLVFFAIFCHITVVPATAQLKEYWPSKTRPGKIRFKSLVMVCVFVITLCLLLYGPTGLAGYFIYGSDTKQDVLANMGDELEVNLARIGMIATTPMRIPVTTMLNRGALFDLLRLPNEIAPGKRQMKMSHITIFNIFYTGLTLGVSLILRYANQDIGFVMSIVGATSGVAIQIGFPAMFLWSMGSKIKSISMATLAVLISTTGLFMTVVLAACGEHGPKTGICVFAK